MQGGAARGRGAGACSNDDGAPRRLALRRESTLELRVDAPGRDVGTDRRRRRRERSAGRAGSLGLHHRQRAAHLASEPRARAVDEVAEAKLLVALVEGASAEERLGLWQVRRHNDFLRADA